MKIFDNCLLSLSSSLFTLQVREKSNKKLRKAESESEEEDVIVLTKCVPLNFCGASKRDLCVEDLSSNLSWDLS